LPRSRQGGRGQKYLNVTRYKSDRVSDSIRKVFSPLPLCVCVCVFVVDDAVATFAAYSTSLTFANMRDAKRKIRATDADAREQIHFGVTISEILFNRMSTVEIAVAAE